MSVQVARRGAIAANKRRAVSGALPGAPTDVQAAPDNTSATLFFTPPAVIGATSGPGVAALTAITGYTATSSPGSLTGSGSGSGAVTVSGLTNGTAYTFTVKTTTSVGTGTASAASNSVTPNARITISAPTDGSDAAIAIQAALTGAAAGRAVYLPAGTYTLSAGNIRCPPSVRFFGAGDTTVLTGVGQFTMRTNSWADHMKLTNTPGSGIACMADGGAGAQTNVHLENVTFRGASGGFAIRLTPESGGVRHSGWTIRKCDFDLYGTALYFPPADSLLIDQSSIVGPDGTQNTLFWGGSNNRISNCVVTGGITGIAFLYFRSSLSGFADRAVMFGNTVFRNTITNISEEGISFDVIGNTAANVAVLDVGNIASKGGTNTITMSGGTWGTAGTTAYVNYYACWVSGNAANRGKIAKITAQSNGTLTLDITNLTWASVSAGDRVVFGAPFANNIVDSNDVTLKSGSGTVGLSLYGLCYNNIVRNNRTTGSPTDKAAAIRALAALLASDINHSGNAGIAPTGYNAVDNNTSVGAYGTMVLDLMDFGSGNGYLNYGDSMTRNTAASGTIGADYHVVATTGNVGDPGVFLSNSAPGGTPITHQT